MTERRLVHAVRSSLGSMGVGSAIEAFDSGQFVALTYDDGPDPFATEQILHQLAASGGKATFFVLLTRARRYPEIVKAIMSEGHEVAFHGVDHTDLATISPLAVRARLKDGVSELEDLSQQATRWFRPPYVSLSLSGWALLSTSCRFVASRSSLGDWEPLGDDERINRFAASLEPGDVILAHDSWPTFSDGAKDGPEPPVNRLFLASETLRILAERGLTTATLSEVAASAPTISAMRVSLRPRHASHARP